MTNNSSLLLLPISYSHRYLGWIIATLLTTSFGTIANIILILATIVHKPLRRSSSFALILHCIVIDLYATTIAVPLDMLPIYLGPAWPLPKYFCTYEALYIFDAYALSCYASFALSFHRLIATISPHRFTILTTKRAIIFLIILPWIISITINIFPTAKIGLQIVFMKYFIRTQGGCTYALTNPDNASPFLIYTVFSYYLPTVLMGISYWIVLTRMSTEVRKKAKTASVALKRRYEISRTLFLSFLWLCVTVYPINLVVYFALETYATNLSLQLFLRWLSTSFGCMNPVFYWASSKLFQNGVKQVLRCRWWKRTAGRKVKPVDATINGVSRTDGLTKTLNTAPADKATFSKY